MLQSYVHATYCVIFQTDKLAVDGAQTSAEGKDSEPKCLDPEMQAVGKPPKHYAVSNESIFSIGYLVRSAGNSPRSHSSRTLEADKKRVADVSKVRPLP